MIYKPKKRILYSVKTQISELTENTISVYNFCISVTTNLWGMRGIKQPEFSEGFMGWCIRTVRDRRAGAFHVIMNVTPLRWTVVSLGTFPWRWRAFHVKSWFCPRRWAEPILVPGLVVVSGSAERAAAAQVHRPLIAAAPRGQRRVQLREARLGSGAVVRVFNAVFFAVTGRKLQLLANGFKIWRLAVPPCNETHLSRPKFSFCKMIT